MSAATSSSHLHAADGRLRPGLRIFVVVVVFLAGMSLAAVPQLWLDGAVATLLQAALTLPLAIGIFLILAPRLDRRPIRSYGMRVDRAWWADLLAGIVIGAGVIATALLVLLGGGWAQIDEVWSAGTAQPVVGAALLASLLLAITVGLGEELVFRGYVITNLAEVGAARRSEPMAVLGAVLLSIPIFATPHVFRIDAPGTAPAGLALLHLVAMGALFGLAYATTGRLGLPLGIHIAHHLGVVSIVGMRGEFSGGSATILRISTEGPSALVGVSGGAQLVGVAVGFVGLWIWLRVRGRPHLVVSIAGADDRTTTPPR